MTKEEKKDEMKNRISMALKDPILQQGFEIICKENAELKNKLEHRNCVDCSNHGSNIKLIKAKEFLKWFVWYFREGSPNLVPYKHKVKEAEQFLKEVSE